MTKHLNHHGQDSSAFPGQPGQASESDLLQGLGGNGGLDAFAGIASIGIQPLEIARDVSSPAIPPLDLAALGEFQFNNTAFSNGSGHIIVAGPYVAGGNVSFVNVTDGGTGALIVSAGTYTAAPPGQNGGTTLIGHSGITDDANYVFDFFADPKNPDFYKFVFGYRSSSSSERGEANFFKDVKVLGWNSDSILLSFAGIGQFPAGDIVISTEDMSKLPGSIPANTTFTTTGPAPIILGTTVPEVPCFAAGTRLSTPDGDRTVETLRPGDLVLTESGQAVPIVWAGARTVACHAHPRPHRVRPVRVRAHAFGPCLPVRDLILSPDHAILWDGVLIPVCELADGRAIVQEAVHSIRYHHIELALHDVLVAEGLPCESFLDIGNHTQFDDATPHPDFAIPPAALAWEAACAPLCLHGAPLAAARAHLAAQAGQPALAA